MNGGLRSCIETVWGDEVECAEGVGEGVLKNRIDVD